MPNTKLKNIITKLADQREISINGVNALRSELNRLIKSADVNLSHIARNAKNYIEGEVLDDILSKTPFSSEARKLYETMVGEYRAMKGISDSGWFAKVSNRDIGERAINNAIAEVLEGGAKNNSVSEFLGKLKPDEVAGVELNLISRALDDSLATMANGGKVLDLNNIVSKIRNLGFRSDEAKYFANMIENLKGVIGQDFELAKAIGAFKKGEKLGQGITQKPLSRLKTMLANRTVKTIIRLAPIIGRQPSLIHHFEQAALKAKSYDGFINNIKQIAQRADVPSVIRTEIDNLLRAKNEAEVANDNKSAVEQMMQNAKLKVENEAGVYSQHAMLHSSNESLAKKDLKGNKLTNAQNRLIKEVDKNKLNSEQKAVYDVFTGKKDKVILQGKDLNDLYELESGSRVGGARKIMIRHAGTEKTGGLSSNELVNLMNVVREGKIVDNSFTLHDNKIRYAYELQKEGTKLRLVVDEFNDGKKVFDYYSDRNFVDYSKNQENGSALKQIMQRAREKAIQDLKKKQGS